MNLFNVSMGEGCAARGILWLHAMLLASLLLFISAVSASLGRHLLSAPSCGGFTVGTCLVAAYLALHRARLTLAGLSVLAGGTALFLLTLDLNGLAQSGAGFGASSGVLAGLLVDTLRQLVPRKAASLKRP